VVSGVSREEVLPLLSLDMFDESEEEDALCNEVMDAFERQRTAWRLGSSGQRCSITEKSNKESVVLQETQTGVHAWNHLPFGVTKKVDCFSVGFIQVFEFSPESF